MEGVSVNPGFFIPESELHFSYARASGPGGQNVNKTSTKARLKWWPENSAALNSSLSQADRARLLKRAVKVQAEDGSVQVVSDQFRTRESNRDACRRKLATLLRQWLKKPKKRIPTKPTRTSRENRIKDKKRTSQIKKSRRRPDMD